MGKMVEFIRPDGAGAPGYLAEAPDLDLQRPPGVVMFEEWWGVDDRIKETADRLASYGFNVLVPDLFRGRSAATGDEANHLIEGLDFVDAASQDGVGAARYLRELGAEHVGVMGFCMEEQESFQYLTKQSKNNLLQKLELSVNFVQAVNSQDPQKLFGAWAFTISRR